MKLVTFSDGESAYEFIGVFSSEQKAEEGIIEYFQRRQPEHIRQNTQYKITKDDSIEGYWSLTRKDKFEKTISISVSDYEIDEVF